MEKEFIPYELAVALKELEFDEPCFAKYTVIPEDEINWFTIPEQGITNKTTFGSSKNYNSKSFEEEGTISAPLYQQAFRFFREKYELDCSFEDEIVFDDDENEIELWNFFIYKSKQVDDKVMKFCSNNSKTYIECFSKEEAELECIKKLIEIVKEN
jgi:hypothetical protein